MSTERSTERPLFDIRHRTPTEGPNAAAESPGHSTERSTERTERPEHRTPPPPLYRGSGGADRSEQAARRGADGPLDRPCPTCAAQPGQPCTTATGAHMDAVVHQSRRLRSTQPSRLNHTHGAERGVTRGRS